jgi:hypothetical protein
MTYEQRLWLQVILPIVIVIPVSILVYFSVGYTAAQFTALGGTAFVVLTNLTWIILIDSKRRWPGVGVVERAMRVFTFYR